MGQNSEHPRCGHRDLDKCIFVIDRLVHGGSG